MKDIDAYTSRGGAGHEPRHDPATDVVIIQVPAGFRHEEALKELAQLVITLLKNGMPEHEIAKRLMRYHPAQEG